ncbi:MAG: hypothetical protein ACFFEF_09720 [Candidatus Thorarchaeota archaeon]
MEHKKENQRYQRNLRLFTLLLILLGVISFVWVAISQPAEPVRSGVWILGFTFFFFAFMTYCCPNYGTIRWRGEEISI